MANYTKTTNFTAKDSLPSGNSGKLIKGADYDTEFDAIATMSGTKEDKTSKGSANGYAGLDSNSRVATANLPSTTVYTDSSNTFTAVQVFPAGTNTAPSIQFTGATSNTGIYSSGTDKVAVTVDGTKRLEVGGTNGNVEVTGTFYASGNATLAGTLGVTGILSLGTAGTEGTPAFTWSGDPNTGIFSDTADHVQISVGGLKKVDIGSSIIEITNGFTTLSVKNAPYIDQSFSVGTASNPPGGETLYVAGYMGVSAGGAGTGTSTPSFAATNKPGSTSSAGPATWIRINVAGTAYYVPAWAA